MPFSIWSVAFSTSDGTPTGSWGLEGVEFRGLSAWRFRRRFLVRKILAMGSLKQSWKFSQSPGLHTNIIKIGSHHHSLEAKIGVGLIRDFDGMDLLVHSEHLEQQRCQPFSRVLEINKPSFTKGVPSGHPHENVSLQWNFNEMQMLPSFLSPPSSAFFVPKTRVCRLLTDVDGSVSENDHFQFVWLHRPLKSENELFILILQDICIR